MLKNSKTLISMQGIFKRFGAVAALSNVDFDVCEGEIHAIVGENGAGKTTLMNILYGVYKPDKGTIFIKDKEHKFKSPRDAIKNGIGMVHQHFSLIPVFTVLEDIILGKEITKNRMFLDRAKAKMEITTLFDSLKLKIDVNAYIKNLSVGEQQKIEIVKALYKGAKILIFDEPTAVLTPQESVNFCETLQNLKSKGYTIILITHKLEEVKEASERLTVLRDGKNIGTKITAKTSTEEIARMMVGRDILFRIKKADIPTKINENLKPVIEVNNISTSTTDENISLKNISFSIYPGEILGIAGVNGNGQRELIDILCGLDKNHGGEIFLNGVTIKDKSCRERISLGIAHIPEDRRKSGLISQFGLMENLILGKQNNREFKYLWFIKENTLMKHSKDIINSFDIRPQNIYLKAEQFSGGNQQKIVISRELSRETKFIIASQPTRGVDIGAIEFIHNSLLSKRKQGAAILLISTELSEIFSLSDRIAVMFKGSLSSPLPTDSVTENQIGMMMLGKNL